MCSYDLKPSLDPDRREALIADVTCAVYQAVLREGCRSNWLDLQLTLWDVVRSRLEAWAPAKEVPLLIEGSEPR